MAKLTIGFVFNIKTEKPSLNLKRQGEAEFDTPEVIQALAAAMKKLGYKVILIEADRQVYEKLKRLKSKLDLVLSIAEGPSMDAREAWVPMICEWLKIPYAFSRPTVHALSLDKALTKKIALAAGVNTPWSALINSPKEIGKIKFKFPVIIKPNREGASKGISNQSVVTNMAGLKKQLKLMINNFGPVLVEKFIDGREFTVSLLGSQPKVLPIVEQTFDLMPPSHWQIAGYELKAFYTDVVKNPGNDYICPAKITMKQYQRIALASQKIFHALGVYDCGRIDWRLDKKGRLYFLEINTLPGLNFAEPDISYFAIAAKAVGYQLSDVMAVIIRGAVKRFRHA